MSQGRGTPSFSARSEAPGEAGSLPEEGSGQALMPPASRRAGGVGGRRGSAAGTLTWRTALRVRGGEAGGGDGNRGEGCAGFVVPLPPSTPQGAGGGGAAASAESGSGVSAAALTWRIRAEGDCAWCLSPSEAGAVPCGWRPVPGERCYRSQRSSFWRGGEGCPRLEP